MADATMIEGFGNIHELSVHAEKYFFFLNSYNMVRRFKFKVHVKDGEALCWVDSQPGWEEHVEIRDASGDASELLAVYAADVIANLGQPCEEGVCPVCNQKIVWGEKIPNTYSGKKGMCGCSHRMWTTDTMDGTGFYDTDN